MVAGNDLGTDVTGTVALGGGNVAVEPGAVNDRIGINPGDVALLDLAVGGGVKLSTGVFVLYADTESFTLMTPQGHMFAG